MATALAFGRQGARCILTYRWGTADEADVARKFQEIEAPPPLMVQADVSQESDTSDLMDALAAEFAEIDTFISNVAVAQRVQTLDDLSVRDLRRTFNYNVAPTVDYLQTIRRKFGRPPKYLIVLSSTGIDHFTPNYALVASSKAALEALGRYIAYHLKDEDCRCNIVRTLAVRTEAFRGMFGPDFENFLLRYMSEERLVNADDVANVILALCSGLFDGMNGQTITVDKGVLFGDNIMRFYDERDKLGL